MVDESERIRLVLLILRCQLRDEAAFEELVATYHPKLRYYVLKLAGREPVDDVLQDVWLDVFRSLPKLRQPAAFPAWLYRLARDRVYRLSRRPGHAPLPAADVLANGPEPVFTAEDAAAIHAGLDALPAEAREVLVLRFLEEMPYDEIATILGCPIGTVRSRLHYAKRALRAVMEGRGKGS